MDVHLTSDDNTDGMGIWISSTEDSGPISEEETEEEEDDEDGGLKAVQESPEESDDESESDSAALQVGGGRFGALQAFEGAETSDVESDAS